MPRSIVVLPTDNNQFMARYIGDDPGHYGLADDPVDALRALVKKFSPDQEISN